MGSYKWVISPLIWAISIVTLLITAHEPPNRAPGLDFSDLGFTYGSGVCRVLVSTLVWA